MPRSYVEEMKSVGNVSGSARDEEEFQRRDLENLEKGWGQRENR